MGNKSPSFLEKRRLGLEKYLKEVFVYLQLSMPVEFVEFLDFHIYDIIFLVQGLAHKFFLSGDLPSRKHTFSALELYAISERLKMPCPPQEYCTKQYDFSHILDFCSTLKSLKIVQLTDNIPEPIGDEWYNKNMKQSELPVGTSNILPKLLKFELSAFKNLKHLTIFEITTENIYNTGTLRETLESISVHQTSIETLNKILLCDDLHKIETGSNDESKVYTFLFI